MADNSILDTLKSEEAKQLLPKIYEDLLQPSVRKVGTALSTVFDLSNTFLLPIRLANEISLLLFQKYMNDYKRKLEQVPQESIVDVPSEIGLPILERLTYTTNEEIADLLTTLLAKASDERTINQAHPGFIQILQRLSVDEARIIKHLGTTKPKRPKLTVDIILKDIDRKPKILVPNSSIQYVKILDRGVGKYSSQLYDLFAKTNIHFEVELSFPENVGAYLDNLSSMGVIRSSILEQPKDDDYEDILRNLWKTTSHMESAKRFLDGLEAGTNSLFYSKYYLTDYGILFVVACNPNF